MRQTRAPTGLGNPEGGVSGFREARVPVEEGHPSEAAGLGHGGCRQAPLCEQRVGLGCSSQGFPLHGPPDPSATPESRKDSHSQASMQTSA